RDADGLTIRARMHEQGLPVSTVILCQLALGLQVPTLESTDQFAHQRDVVACERAQLERELHLLYSLRAKHLIVFQLFPERFEWAGVGNEGRYECRLFPLGSRGELEQLADRAFAPPRSDLARVGQPNAAQRLQNLLDVGPNARRDELICDGLFQQ